MIYEKNKRGPFYETPCRGHPFEVILLTLGVRTWGLSDQLRAWVHSERASGCNCMMRYKDARRKKAESHARFTLKCCENRKKVEKEALFMKKMKKMCY